MLDAQQNDAKVTTIKQISSLAEKSVVFNHHTSKAAAIFIPSSLFMSLKNLIEAQAFADVMQHKLCKPCKATSMCALNAKRFTHPLMSSVLFFIKLNSFTSTVVLKMIRLNVFFSFYD